MLLRFCYTTLSLPEASQIQPARPRLQLQRCGLRQTPQPKQPLFFFPAACKLTFKEQYCKKAVNAAIRRLRSKVTSPEVRRPPSCSREGSGQDFLRSQPDQSKQLLKCHTESRLAPFAFRTKVLEMSKSARRMSQRGD